MIIVYGIIMPITKILIMIVTSHDHDDHWWYSSSTGWTFCEAAMHCQTDWVQDGLNFHHHIFIFSCIFLILKILIKLCVFQVFKRWVVPLAICDVDSLFSHCADFQSAENNCRQSCFTSDRSTNKQDPEATKHFIFWQKHFSSKMRWTSERCHMPSDLQRPSQFLNKSSTTLVIKRILSKCKQNFIRDKVFFANKMLQSCSVKSAKLHHTSWDKLWQMRGENKKNGCICHSPTFSWCWYDILTTTKITFPPFLHLLNPFENKPN